MATITYNLDETVPDLFVGWYGTETMSVDPADPFSGNGSLKVQTDGVDGVGEAQGIFVLAAPARANFPAAADDQITLRFAAKGSTTLDVRIDGLTEGDVQYSLDGGGTVIQLTAEWQTFAHAVTVADLDESPAVAVVPAFLLPGPDAGAAFWIDSIELDGQSFPTAAIICSLRT